MAAAHNDLVDAAVIIHLRASEIFAARRMSAVYRANKVLGPRFITKYGTKQGVLVLSKQIPLGLGIGVGAFSSHIIGRTIVATAKKVFGPAPEHFEPQPDSIVIDAESVEVAGADRLEIGDSQ